jgi:hypothetical protein
MRILNKSSYSLAVFLREREIIVKDARLPVFPSSEGLHLLIYLSPGVAIDICEATLK